jgi:hypothetical protein
MSAKEIASSGSVLDANALVARPARGSAENARLPKREERQRLESGSV